MHLASKSQAKTAAKPHKRAESVLASFRYAFAGLAHLIATQRNAQIHCAAIALVVALGAALGISRVEWAVLAVTCTLVIAAEGVNTAVEAVVDLASPDFHPLAKVAKDVAAGTVLLTAIGAVAVGLLIFGPPLLSFVVR